MLCASASQALVGGWFAAMPVKPQCSETETEGWVVWTTAILLCLPGTSSNTAQHSGWPQTPGITIPDPPGGGPGLVAPSRAPLVVQGRGPLGGVAQSFADSFRPWPPHRNLLGWVPCFFCFSQQH